MQCPKCELKAAVLDSRYEPEHGYMRRRRECPDHGRFTTYEYTGEVFDKMIEAQKQLNLMRDILRGGE